MKLQDNQLTVAIAFLLILGFSLGYFLPAKTINNDIYESNGVLKFLHYTEENPFFEEYCSNFNSSIGYLKFQDDQLYVVCFEDGKLQQQRHFLEYWFYVQFKDLGFDVRFTK